MIWPTLRLLFTALLLGQLLPAQASPDFNKAHDEALKFLVDLVKIDTSNPPGNETRAAEYIKSVLAAEGIQAQIYESAPGRGSVVARLKGNGKKKPLLLMGHLDVVGVERDRWTVDPFAAIIKDGYLYGRGSHDDKAMDAANLEVFLLLHRLKVPLDRDVILLGEPGYYSMVRTSLVPTIINGGFRSNVIPAQAEARLDVRALPDEDMTALKAQLARLINDRQVEIVDAETQNARPATSPSGLNTDAFHALEHAQQKVFPGVPTIPIMQAGATDSSELRAKGVQAYGLGTPSSAEDRKRIHGNDERVDIAGFGKFVEFLYAATVEIAGAK